MVWLSGVNAAQVESMGSKVLLSVGVLLVVAAAMVASKSVPEQRSHLDLAELDSSEEQPGTIDRVKGFFGDLSTRVKEGVQEGVVKVKDGVKKGSVKAKEYATNVRDYLRDKFSSDSKEAEVTTTTTTTTAKSVTGF